MLLEPQVSTIGRRLASRAVAVASEMAKQEIPPGAVDLTQPATPEPPPVVAAAAHAALDRGETHYTDRPGIPALCQALAVHSTSEGFMAETDAVVVTNGGAEALYIALQSVVQPGQRVLLAGPVDPSIPTMIDFIGGSSIQPQTSAANRFNPTVATITDNPADIVLLASPSPITGAAIPPAELADIARAAIERGMTIILDRALAWSSYDPSLARFAEPELANQMLTTGSFSHAYDMEGWRAGYFTAPAEFAGRMVQLKQAMSICTSTISQYAALAALEDGSDWLTGRRDTMQARRDMVIHQLEQAGLSVVQPDAWPWLLLDTRLIHPDDQQAADMLRQQAGVVVEPASAYSPSLAGYTRITLAAGEDLLTGGLDRLIGFHNTCR